MARQVSRCECGGRKSKHVPLCNKCLAAKNAARTSESRAIVATGECPCCGSKIARNWSLAGWWQCEQYGAETHRARPGAPACSWQTFTE